MNTNKTMEDAENSGMTKVILVRHGQSLGNAAEIYLGHTDLDLSSEGYRQALVAAEALREERINAVYSSSLLRAHNTALPHAEMRGLSVIDSDELKEIYLGEWEGCKISDLLTVWRDEFIGGWKENFGIYCPPGGESVPHLAERMYNAVLNIAKANIGCTVLIASHAAAIRSFWGRVSGVNPECVAKEIPFPANASFTTVYYDGEHLIPIKYSDDTHFKT